ncbi:MAG: formate hydrogenlyase maturation HycH family protein [Collinsella sp.]
MELTDRSGYFAGPGMLGGSFGDASRASDEAAEGVADPAGPAPRPVVFYELTRKFVETEEDVPQETCDVLYYTLAVGHHTGVLDCFEPRLSVPVDVFYSLVDALPEGRLRQSSRPSAPLASASSTRRRCRRCSRPAMHYSTSAVFAGRPRPASRCSTTTLACMPSRSRS